MRNSTAGRPGNLPPARRAPGSPAPRRPVAASPALGLAATFAVLLSVAMVTVEGRRGVRSVLPLRAKDSLLQTQNRSPGCRLGDRFYDLNETWSPELEPVGVMHCIVCQCQPAVKKGILQTRGRVNCRNIKHDCPPVNCTNPELKPGQCCKLCEGQDPSLAHALSLKRFPSFRFRSNTEFHVASAPRAVHRPTRSKEYLSLMVGAHAPVPPRTSAVARGRFTLRDAALYFSIHFTGTERPRQLRIIDRSGAVLFLYDITDSPQGNSLTICGVWRPLHSEHTIKLNDGRLMALLSTADVGSGLVAGKILSHRALAKESFSAILRPQQNDGSGAVAMVAIAGNGNVNFIIKMAGVQIPAGTNRSVTVMFRKGSRVLHQSTGELLGPDLEFAEVWTDLSHRESRMLARGVVSITVMTSPETTSQRATLRGVVTSKQTCDTLHAVMSGGAALTSSRASGAAGSALVRLSTDGTLHYLIHLVGMQSRVTDITFEMAPNKRGRTRRLCRVTSRLSRRRGTFDGWANGTCDKLNSRLVHALFHGEVYVNVVTRNVALSALRGAVNKLLYNADIDKLTDPGVLLSGHSMSPPGQTDVAGNVWARLDDACALHYELVVSGLSKGDDSVLMAQLATLPPDNGRLQEPAKLTLEEFVGNVARGVAPTLTPALYEHMATGDLLLKVTTKAQPMGVIAGKIHLPNRCVASGSQSNTLGILYDEQEQSEEEQERRCVIDGVIYNNGDIWVSNKTEHNCVTCNCKGNQEECHSTVCPETDCENPVRMEGECCLQCLDGTVPDRKCYFDGDKRWHRYGTRWHPYMPPFGYMTCAVCSCTEGAEGAAGAVNCIRKACPPLACPESAAVRRTPAACCKVCPEAQNTTLLSEDHNIQGDIAMAGSCPFRGQRFADGMTWNPRVQPFGRLACVTCRCHSGATQCRRQKCAKLTCARKVYIQDACCPICDNGDNRETINRNNRKRSRRMI